MLWLILSFQSLWLVDGSRHCNQSVQQCIADHTLCTRTTKLCCMISHGKGNWSQIEGFRRLTTNLADSPDASRLRICRCSCFLDIRSSKCVISARSWLSTTPPLLNPNRNVGGHFLIFIDETAGGDGGVGLWVLKTFSFASGCLPSAIRSRWLGRSSVLTFTCQNTHVKLGLIARNQQKYLFKKQKSKELELEHHVEGLRQQPSHIFSTLCLLVG